MDSRTRFGWNVAYNYIMGIKDAYMAEFGRLDTLSCVEMAQRLHTAEYSNFLRCVDIHVCGALNGFKYSIIKGGKTDLYANPASIYREMRGLVIDMETEEIVVAPFRKFFNINEIPETSLEHVEKEIKAADLVEITNKLDGSMVSARYYDGQIFLAGTGCIDKTISFRLQEAESWLTDGHRKMLQEHPDQTFIFEYISWNDKHVVEYKQKEQNIYLIGARDVLSGRQATYHELACYARNYDVPITAFEGSSLDVCLQKRERIPSNQKEGWVLYIRTPAGVSMYKLKCTDYLDVHAVLSRYASPDAVIKAIARGTFDDLLAKMPVSCHERLQNFYDMVQCYLQLKNDQIESAYASLADITEPKAFAAEVYRKVDKAIAHYMFLKRKGFTYSLLEPKPEHFLKFHELDEFLKAYGSDDAQGSLPQNA